MSGAADPDASKTWPVCHCALGDFQLQRYPARRKEMLRAWCGADLLLLEALADHPLPTSAIVVNDEHGALSTALSSRGIATTLWSDSALSAHAAALNTARNGAPEVRVVWSTEPPPLAAELVLIRVPKQMALLRQQLESLAANLAPGTRVLAAAMDKHTPAGLEEQLALWIGPTRRERGRHKAHLWHTQRAEQAAAAPHEPGTRYTCEALGATVYSLPNVFSRDGLDIGTRFLLSQLHQLDPVSCAIDLACGNGVIGLAAFKAGLAETIGFCDESAQAVASARINAQQLLPAPDTQAYFHHGDGLLNWAGPAPKLILCNPPFHSQHVVDEFVGRRLIQQAAEALLPGGVLCLVANRHLDYRNSFKHAFRQWRVLAENAKFRIYIARR
ncbi:MAG: class I SAM-dependent methyltransferase [Haliea sp.]|jgi:23S rRNA (guanine1835-N2)-methyltransferase|nr:class I SAM-dependent methyltransferase [Haliea sp.]MDP5064655.1 class I SAM-dependent methyltransferase [Haliea sp.]